MERTRARSAAIGVLVAALTLAGCTDDDGDDPATTTSTTAPATTTTSSPTAAATTTSTPDPTTTAPTTSTSPVPAPVSGVTATTGGGSGEVEVSWLPLSSADVASYRVYKRRANGTELAPVTIPASIPPIAPGRLGIVDAPDYEYWPTTGPDPGPRCYRVSAVSTAGVEGPQSAEACGSPVGG